MTLPSSGTPYHALSSDEIRLLTVVGTHSAGFTYDLVKYPLEGAPAFEALSYVWGLQERSFALRLQSNAVIHITPSLSETLQRLSPQCAEGHFWVDQICINQTDWDERSRQVNIMGKIYSKARRVLVWLDKEEDDANELCSTESTDERHWAAVGNVLGRPWFHRGWVVQEAILPPDVIFFLGTRSFDINTMWKLVSDARDRQEEHGSDSAATPGIRHMSGCLVLFEIWRLRQERRRGNRRRKARQENEQGCFYYTLSTFAPRCRTTKYQDSIFGFLGLMTEPHVQITPDYSMNPEQVPVMATRQMINGTESLDLLGVLHRAPRDPSQTDLRTRIPSWVPDWTMRLRSESMVYYGWANYFQAAGDRRHIVDTITPINRLQLVVFGKKIARVHKTFHSGEHGPIPSSNRYGWDAHSCLDLTRVKERIAKAMPTGLTAPTSERLLTTLLADGSFALDRKYRHQEGLPKDYIDRLLQVYDKLQVQHSQLMEEEARLVKALREHARITWGRAIIIRSDLRLGLAHKDVEEGDLICIIHGSKVPLILRCEKNVYHVLGQCYYEGIMRGEALKGWKEEDADQFVLI